MLIHDHLARAAERWPERIAVAAAGRGISFAALWDAAGRLASALRARGVDRGDRVALFCPNGVDAAVAIFGALRAGAALVPLHPTLRPRKLARHLADAEPRALVAEAALARTWMPALRDVDGVRAVLVAGGAAPGELGPRATALADALEGAPAPGEAPGIIDQDLAAIIYTSGSVGEPKGVMLSHLNMVSALESVSAYLPIGEDDVIASPLTLAHSYGLYQLFQATRAGARLAFLPSFAFPGQVLAEMVRARATVFPGVPTHFLTLLGLEGRDRFDLAGVRIVTAAAAPLAPRDLPGVRALFPRADLYCMYGLTECKRVSFLPPGDLDRRPGSVGRGMPNQELWLVDEEGRRLPPGGAGELVVRGSHVMRGYWRRPRETAARLRPGPLPGEQVLMTGDLFRSDGDGYLYFLARRDDIIKVGGEKVSLREVEDALSRLDGVLEAAALGIADPISGQAVEAFVVPRPGALLDGEDLRRACKARLEAPQVPRRIEIVEALPRNNSGKVDKRALRGAEPDDESEERHD
jgi:long-chain acyl-CoA synthetase